MNVSVRLLFFEERQGSHQLRAGVSGRDAERWPSNAICYKGKSVPVRVYVNRRVECGGLTAVMVVVQRVKGGSVYSGRGGPWVRVVAGFAVKPVQVQ